MSDFTTHEAPVHSARELPTMLPGKLIGREQALAQVYAHLKGRKSVLLYGLTGSGKTALAATLAAAYAQQPGGVLWLNIDNPRLEELLVRVGRAYQVEEITHSENPLSMIGAVENTLKANKPFIVIEGTIQEDVVSRFITRCMDGLPILITANTRLSGPWETHEITPLEPDDATALFKRESRTESTEHDNTIGSLVGLVNQLPFAIVLMARSMLVSKKSPSEFLTIMEKISGEDNPGTIALKASFATLTNVLQGLILMMGATFNGQISSQLMTMVSGSSGEAVEKAMNILAQLSLIGRHQRYGANYYMMHSLSHEFALMTLRNSNRLDDLQKKMRDTILTYARQYQGSTNDAYQKLATEMDTFMAAARWGVSHNDREVASALVSVISESNGFVSTCGYLYEQLQLRALSTGSDSAFPAYDDDRTIDILDDNNEVTFDDEDVLEAILEDSEDDEQEDIIEIDDIMVLRSSLAQAKQAGDVEKQLEILQSIGTLQIEQGMQNEAIPIYSETLALHEDSDNQTGILETLDMLSALMVKTENSQAAIMNATHGIKLADELDNKITKLQLYLTLGDAHQQLGESDTAIKDYGEALAIARMTNDKQNEAIAFYRLGNAQLDDGNAGAAVDTWERALALFKSQEKRDYEGRTLGGLGNAYGELNRWAEAVNFHTSALHIAREIDDKDEEALQLSSLAYAATQAKQLGEAVLRYRQALHLAYEKDDIDNIVSNIVDLVRLLVESRKHVTVAELLINDAYTREPNDRDVSQLKQRVDSEKMLAEAYKTNMIEVTGTATEYAANAYAMLDS